jgi:hypothetical protein
MTERDRLRLDWYSKRSDINRRFQQFFIDKIYQHNSTIDLDPERLKSLPYEDLAELAMAVINLNLEITLGQGQDYTDGSDAKCSVSSHRNNDKKRGCWTNSYRITGIKDKTGDLRAVCYNDILDEFEFFLIPRSAYKDCCKNVVEIVIERVTQREGSYEFTGKRNTVKSKWYQYKKSTFEELAQCQVES